MCETKGLHRLPFTPKEEGEYIIELFRAEVGAQKRITVNEPFTNKALEYFYFSKAEYETTLFGDLPVYRPSSFLPTLFKTLIEAPIDSVLFRAVLFSSRYAFEWLEKVLMLMYGGEKPNAVYTLGRIKAAASKTVDRLGGYHLCQYLHWKIMLAVYMEFGFYCKLENKRAYEQD